MPKRVKNFFSTPALLTTIKKRNNPGTEPTYSIHHLSCKRTTPAPTNQAASLAQALTNHPTTSINHKCCGHLWARTARECKANAHAHICTDGSTFKSLNIPSAAAFTLMEDNIHTKELWGMQSYYWTVTLTNNHAAELAAINSALRAIPITADITIHTDSQSCIDAIQKHRHLPTQIDLTRCAARPYLLSALRAIQLRDAHNSATTLLHVRSHTGKRDKPSIGNSEADACAKWQALQNEPPKSDISLMENELPFTLDTISTKTDTDTGTTTTTYTPTHGDVRKALNKTLFHAQLQEWAARPTRGELIRLSPKAITNLIRTTWNEPTTEKITFLLDTLPQCAKRDPATKYTTPLPCTHCGTHAPATATHRILTCPTIAHLWNANTKNTSTALDITLDSPKGTSTLTTLLEKLATDGRAKLNPALGCITIQDFQNPSEDPIQLPHPDTLNRLHTLREIHDTEHPCKHTNTHLSQHTNHTADQTGKET